MCGVGVGVRRGLRGASVPRWSASPRGAARGTRLGARPAQARPAQAMRLTANTKRKP